MRLSSLAALALAAVLSACSTTPRPGGDYPPVPPSQRPVAPKPAAPPLHGAVIPGPPGPLASAQIGNYMDSLETTLRRHLRGVVVARQGDNIDVVIPNTAVFTPEGEIISGGVFDPLAAILRGYPHTVLQVGAYTDTWGPADRNLALTGQRAHAVADALVRAGVPASHVSAQGFGETHLRVATADDRKEPRNRRIEIVIKARAGA
ncbi:MAG: OmpA family protein [Proteobacteria bacterium]|nr:OmpA family protein [Pseudomonadota bacterium]